MSAPFFRFEPGGRSVLAATPTPRMGHPLRVAAIVLDKDGVAITGDSRHNAV